MKTRQVNFLGRRITFNPLSISPDILDEKKYPSVNSLAIDVAGDCNLKCIYCAESITMPKRQPISQEMLDRALSALFSWSKPESAVSIHLGSGEALLYPEIVQEIGKKSKRIARAQKRAISLYLTTNGTCLNNEIIDWLIKDDWNVKISFDGDQETHNQNRKYKTGQGTYDKVSEAVEILAKKIPNKFSTTSVLCRGTDPSKVFYSIAAHGVKRIELVPVAMPQGSKLLLNRSDLLSYERFITDYVQKLASGEDVPVNIRFHNRFLRVLGYKNNRTPCGAGRNFFAVSPNGVIYPCFRFIGIERYILGDLDGIQKAQVQDFINRSARSYEQRTPCCECWVAPLCGGPCFACAELFGLGLPLKEYCEMVHEESKAALWLVDVLKESDPEMLVELLGLGFLWDNA
jgi:uncharacterized protein